MTKKAKKQITVTLSLELLERIQTLVIEGNNARLELGIEEVDNETENEVDALLEKARKEAKQ